jgi:hypothetical protein
MQCVSARNAAYNKKKAHQEDPYSSSFTLRYFFLALSPRRLHALLHLRDITRCHTSERIQRRFVFLLAMSNQFVVCRASRVRCYWRALIYFTLPESERPMSVISVTVDKKNGTIQAHPTL